MERTQRIALFMFGIAFLATGYFIAKIKYFEPRTLERESRSWKNAVCSIVSSKAEIIPGDEDVGTKYKLRVKYKYEVGENSYQSERYNFQDNELASREELDSLLNLYQPGAKCLTFYQPADPTHSAIDRAVSTGAHGPVSLAFVAIGGFALIASLRGLILRSRPSA